MKTMDAHVWLGQGRHLQSDLLELLREMDLAGVVRAVASPVDRFVAVENREGNDLILDAVRAHPDRLLGLAVANPWFGKKAVAELKRALSAGLSGLMIHSVYQGFRLSDRLVDPLLAVAREFDAPVYAHTGTAGLAEPLQAAELARRFPSVRFIMGHAGASDYSEDAVRALEGVSNLWLETSRNGPANYSLFKVSGALPRLVFGSGYPEYLPSVEIRNLRDVVTEPAEQDAVLGGTLKTIFKFE